MNTARALVPLVFAAGTSLGVPASGAAFSNGSFESPAIPGGAYLQFDGSTIGPWTISAPPTTTAEFISGTHVNLAPYDADQFVTFNGYEAPSGSSIFQDFDTVPSTFYTVTFAVGRLGAAGGALRLEATALAGASTLATQGASAPAGAGTWTTYTLNFVATTTTTRLQFTDTSPDTLGMDVALDGVTVVPTPAASTSLFVAGLLGARRRR